jgi:branched-chain amino acid transport system permease protein
VSDTATRTLGDEVVATPMTREPARRRPLTLLLLLALLVMLAVPLYLEAFWLRLGFAAFGAIIGAIGLNLLVGTTGQLSLAHAFFLAVGAITYVFVAGVPGPGA